MKIAIVIDSSSGLTEKEAKARGWHFLPLYINIDGIEYKDGVDLTHDNFLSIYKSNSIGKTSCTPIGEVLNLFEQLSKENDFVVVYPISHELSSQYNNLELISKQFKNVFVIKSKRVCQFIVRDLVDLEADVLSNKLTLKQAINVIEKKDYSQVDILLYPKDINVLVRGGRLAPSAAKLAKLLKIFPVIGLEEGRLEKFSKGRTFDKTFFNTAIDQYKKLSKKSNRTILFLDTANQESEALSSKLKEEIDYEHEIIRRPIPPVIAIHTGYEAISIFFVDVDPKDIDKYKI